MAQHYSPPWTSTIALMLTLLALGASISCTGLALEHSQQFIDVADSSHRHAPRILSAAAGAATNLTALDLAARYRPPIINLLSQGGPVLSQPINLYIIWYGAWAATEKSVIRTALTSLTPAVPIGDFPNLSNLWTVMTKYNQQVAGQAPTYVTNNVTVVQEVDDGLTIKTINSSADPVLIIINQISLGNLPEDLAQGVYFVLTASDITYLDTQAPYCGYHSSECMFSTVAECSSAANYLVYAFVPLSTATNTFAGCNLFDITGIPGTPPNSAISPMGELDSMVSVVMHELLELAVDPYSGSMSAYIYNTSENSETGDLCTYNFVAGEWYYCDLPSVYPDFNTSNQETCLLWGRKIPTAGDPSRSLIDPVTNVSFNLYGVGGSQYLVQKIWSLDNKGCVLAPEDACPTTTVTSLDVLSGNISRGYFVNGVGLQAYAPGQNCTWQIEYSIQKTITFTFGIYALGYDALDYIQVWQNGALVTTLTGFGSNVVVTAIGTVFNLNFVTDGSRSPYPISAGFTLTYTAV